LEGFLLFIHIVVCLLLIIVVLLQSGKSADLAGAFGGQGSQSSFGPRGAATLLSKMTTILAVMFMVLTLLLMIYSSRRSSAQSVLDKEEVKQEQKSGETQPKPAEKPQEEKPTGSETQ
jgi:preprotein translocase subunit SecG